MTNSKLVNSRSAWLQIRVPVTEEIEDAIINYKLWNDFVRLLKNSGLLIISGILKDERNEVLEQISKKLDLKVIDQNTKEDWMAFVLKKEQIN